jgi:hypothetical protein
MLVACRLAGLSALETYYEAVNALAQFGPTQRLLQGIVGKADEQDGVHSWDGWRSRWRWPGISRFTARRVVL